MSVWDLPSMGRQLTCDHESSDVQDALCCFNMPTMPRLFDTSGTVITDEAQQSHDHTTVLVEQDSPRRRGTRGVSMEQKQVSNREHQRRFRERSKVTDQIVARDLPTVRHRNSFRSVSTKPQARDQPDVTRFTVTYICYLHHVCITVQCWVPIRRQDPKRSKRSLPQLRTSCASSSCTTTSWKSCLRKHIKQVKNSCPPLRLSQRCCTLNFHHFRRCKRPLPLAKDCCLSQGYILHQHKFHDVDTSPLLSISVQGRRASLTSDEVRTMPTNQFAALWTVSLRSYS